MTIAALLLDTDYTGMYNIIGTVPCIFLAAVEVAFTALYIKKNKAVYFFLFLAPSFLTILYANTLVEMREPYFGGLGILSVVFMLIMLLMNIINIFKK